MPLPPPRAQKTKAANDRGSEGVCLNCQSCNRNRSCQGHQCLSKGKGIKSYYSISINKNERDRNTLKSKQAPQRALQKAFYQLRVFSDQGAQLHMSRITTPGGPEPAGQEREGNGFAKEGQGQGCSSCAQAMSCSH